MRALRLMACFIASTAGCAQDLDDELDADPFDDFVVDEPGLDPASCAAIEGTFTADALEFTSFDEPFAFEDFGGAPEFTTTLDPFTSTFESSMTVGEEVLTSTGTFTVIGDQIVFSEAFVPGMDDSPVALGCQLSGSSLVLFGETAFDFDATDETDDFVDSELSAIFTGSFAD